MLLRLVLNEKLCTWQSNDDTALYCLMIISAWTVKHLFAGMLSGTGNFSSVMCVTVGRGSG